MVKPFNRILNQECFNFVEIDKIQHMSWHVRSTRYPYSFAYARINLRNGNAMTGF